MNENLQPGDPVPYDSGPAHQVDLPDPVRDLLRAYANEAQAQLDRYLAAGGPLAAVPTRAAATRNDLNQLCTYVAAKYRGEPNTVETAQRIQADVEQHLALGVLEHVRFRVARPEHLDWQITWELVNP